MRYREARRRAMKRPIVHGNGFIQVGRLGL